MSIENTFWANTVVASGTAVGIVIYTGPETRSMMNNNEPRSKVGLLDYEVNELTKLLFAAVVILAFAMICLKGIVQIFTIKSIKPNCGNMMMHQF